MPSISRSKLFTLSLNLTTVDLFSFPACMIAVTKSLLKSMIPFFPTLTEE